MSYKSSSQSEMRRWNNQRGITLWCDYGPIVTLPVAVLVLTPAALPRWAFMWMLAGALVVGCKWLTWRQTPVEGVPWWCHIGYLCFWPGMDAPTFLRSPSVQTHLRPPIYEWAVAFTKCILGGILFWFVPRFVLPEQVIVFGWVGMVGLVLMLHFGLFHVLSCAWRTVGVEARPLMDRPLTSSSVREFWGRRWNTAFRDLTHRFIFRPLNARLGPRWALLVGFLISGLIHEAVISVPAHGGYGLPTLFFLLQAGAISIERSRFGKRLGLGRGWRGWTFTMLVLMLPVYGLFHPPFVTRIIVPFMRAVGVQ